MTLRAFIVLLSAALLLAACGSSGERSPADGSSSATPTEASAGLDLLIRPGEPRQSGDSMLAAISGEIVEIDGCVYIDRGGALGLTLPWWPAGVTVEGDTIVVPESPFLDPGVYAIGDHLSAGGGYFGNSRVAPTQATDAILNGDLDQATMGNALRCLERSAEINTVAGIHFIEDPLPTRRGRD